MKRMLWVLPVVTLLAACGKPEPTYKGKPLSEWVALTDDQDAATSKGALDVLVNLTNPDTRRITMPILKKHMQDKPSIACLFASSADAGERELGLKTLMGNIESNSNREESAFMLKRVMPKPFELLPTLKAMIMQHGTKMDWSYTNLEAVRDCVKSLESKDI